MDTAAEASAPLVYGLALKTPAGTVDRIVGALVRYHRRIGSRWQLHGFPLQAVLTCAFLEGGHTYRSLAEGNGVPKSTCCNLIQEGIKVLARRALPLTEVVRLAVKAGWDHLIVDGVNIPTERVNGRIGRKQPWYSGKHKRHGGSGTTIAAPDGELLWVSGLLPGRTVDIRAARRFRIADKVLAHLVRPKPPCAASANERTPSSSAGKSWPATSAATPDRSRWSSRPS
ncbi:transposase family protein [Streptomyces brevispora]|uniref:DDE Tnp4 domain-containing protein n=1 Tax=Streptomyces brevispora TaxID=887462 RepID=A0ABZ1FYX1_9ACTN|nr:transposase family protein [Streptomyces brevispora]WSC12799.1 hypothetical protein OIE64_08095 [Streptomyces brevispora]